MPMNNDLCRTCGAPIVWIKTLAGKAMPCNADGVLVIADPKAKEFMVSATGIAGTCRRAGPEDINERREIRYTSHFATCPQAAQHRRTT